MTDAILRYDVDSELDDDEAQAADWRESYGDSVELSEEQEPAESLFASKGTKASQEDDEE